MIDVEAERWFPWRRFPSRGGGEDTGFEGVRARL
jgi:hypothetical protein